MGNLTSPTLMYTLMYQLFFLVLANCRIFLDAVAEK